MSDGAWSNNDPYTVVIPAGATTGARIVLNGVTGQIQIFDSANDLVGLLDQNGIEYLNANGAYVRMYEGSFGGIITPHGDGAVIAMQPPTQPGSNYYPAIYNAASITSGGRNYGLLLIMPPFDQNNAATVSCPRISMGDDAGDGTGGTFLLTMEGSNLPGTTTIDTNVVFSNSFGGSVKDGQGQQFLPAFYDTFNGTNGGTQNITTTSYVDVTGIVTAGTLDKRFSGTKVRVDIQGSAFAAVIGAGWNLIYGVHMNGTDFDVGFFHFNAANVHQAFGASAIISGLPAAFYGGVQLRAKLSAAGGNTATIDFNDHWSIFVSEVSA